MADHTTRKTTTDRLEEAIARLTSSQTSLSNKYSDLAGKVDSILDHLRLRETSHNQPNSNPSFNHRHSIKHDIPRFDGRDPLGWIFKIQQMFDYQNTPEEERITVASFYLDGAALSWYQWMFSNGFITSWTGFLQALESRFTPTFYEDPKGALFKLSQRGSVNDYLTEFERLANRVIGLPPPFLLSCFVSGLSPEIKREVLALQPISLPQATALAKLQEDKLRDRRSASSRPFNPPPPSNNPSNPSPKPRQPFVQRTPEEMAFRRDKGLCYNCDDKWHSGHRCKGKIQLFIVENSASDLTEPDTVDTSDITEPVSDDPETHSSHVSLHALSGLSSPETFRLYGTVNHARLTILIDSGSTHNFLQPRVAQFLHLPTKPTLPLRVLVGNGSVLDCNQVCPNTQLSLQGHTFEITFHLLPISGADAVLGIEWLKQFGPITTDYSTSLMKFTHSGHDIELHADVETGPEPASASQIKRLVRIGSTSALFHLSILTASPTEPPPSSLSHPIPAINTLLHQYQKLFQPPSTTPSYTPHQPPSRNLSNQCETLQIPALPKI